MVKSRSRSRSRSRSASRSPSRSPRKAKKYTRGRKAPECKDIKKTERRIKKSNDGRAKTFWMRFLLAYHCASKNKKYSDSMVQASAYFKKHPEFQSKPWDHLTQAELDSAVASAIRS